MSSVFISNVDDYLAPSQACVNPMFADDVNKKAEETKQNETDTTARVIPRKRARAKTRIDQEQTSTSSSPAKVSMADCLACSGCVTTAETVLIEHHSLDTLQHEVAYDLDRPVVVTISPASWADFVRKLGENPSLSLKRRLATFLHDSCRASVVLDGQVPLQWSLLKEAQEFCEAYRAQQSEKSFSKEDSTTTVAASLPMLASSCPALVCLVEKSVGAAVPHLATTKSPMSMAGAYYRKSMANAYHISIMPCHDKKLEASRQDLYSGKEPDVNLVITTAEFWTLVCETLGTEDVEEIRNHFHGLAMSAVTCDVASIHVDDFVHASPTLVVLSMDEDLAMEDATQSDATKIDTSDAFFPYGSGGYADFIFRHACKQLFGHVLVEEDLPWALVVDTQSQQQRVASARVRRRQRRDYYQVSLYRHADETYSCVPQHGSVPVLRFGIAYGSQTIQRVLQQAPFSSGNKQLPFDYVEVMACPSGCPNGGGQIRAFTDMRETPSETRQRIQETMQIMSNERISVDSGHDVPVEDTHTSFKVVPPLQLTTGAVAGVALQDTQW